MNRRRNGLIAVLASAIGVLAVVAVILVLRLTGVIGQDRIQHKPDGADSYAFRNVTHAYNYVLQMEDGRPEPVYQICLIDVCLAEDADVPRALTDKLEALREKRQEQLRNRVLEEAQMVYLERMSSETRWHDGWTLQETFHAERADSVCVSFCMEEYRYTGGMHPGVIYNATTLDAQTGEDIGFDEIVKDDAAFADAVENELRQDKNYTHVTEYYETDAEETFAEYLLHWYLTDETGTSLVWSLTENGVHVWFSDYAFGAYAMGHGDILVPFASYPELFRENRYTDRDVLPQSAESPEVHHTERKEDIDLEDFCFREGGFLLGAYNDLAGIYTGEDRTELEISLFGSFFLYDADGMIQTSGQLRHVTGGLRLYEAAYDDDLAAGLDDHYYASVTLPEDHSFSLNGVIYTYNAERSAAQGYISGAKEPIALAEGEMEGNWVDVKTGNEILLYEWRGEFEFINGATGDMLTGIMIYNGNPDAPAYQLWTLDGDILAEIYFYDGDTNPRMMVMFYDDNIPGGAVGEYVKAMG